MVIVFSGVNHPFLAQRAPGVVALPPSRRWGNAGGAITTRAWDTPRRALAAVPQSRLFLSFALTAVTAFWKSFLRFSVCFLSLGSILMSSAFACGWRLHAARRSSVGIRPGLGCVPPQQRLLRTSECTRDPWKISGQSSKSPIVDPDVWRHALLR